VTPGRRRGLAQLAGPSGGIALGLLAAAEPSRRAEACAALAPHLSAVALDVRTAAAACADGSLPGECGLAVDLAEPGPADHPRLDPAASAAFARRLGASAGYLRIALRAEAPDEARRTLRVARAAVALCHAEDLPLVLHLQTGPVRGESRISFATHAMRHAREAAALLEPVAADLLVVPLSAGDGLGRPWACALSASGADELVEEVVCARALGAVGFATGSEVLAQVTDATTLAEPSVPLAETLRRIAAPRVAAFAA